MGNNNYIFLILIASIGLFVVGLIYGIEKSKDNAIETTYGIDLSGGQYVRLVFIGSSTCFYANNTETIYMVSNIKNKLKTVLEKDVIKFISTGISYDRSTTIAINYLKKTGPYDELLVGAGAFNLGIINYVSGSSSTPKVLIFHELYETDLSGLNINNLHSSQSLLKTYTGQFEIRNLYESIKYKSRDDLLMYFGINK